MDQTSAGVGAPDHSADRYIEADHVAQLDDAKLMFGFVF
jgi:hypothetical protein